MIKFVKSNLKTVLWVGFSCLAIIFAFGRETTLLDQDRTQVKVNRDALSAKADKAYVDKTFARKDMVQREFDVTQEDIKDIKSTVNDIQAEQTVMQKDISSVETKIDILLSRN